MSYSPNSTVAGFLGPSSLIAPLEDAALDAFIESLIAGITNIDPNLVRARWQPTPPVQPPITVDWCAVGITQQDADTFAYTARDATTGELILIKQEDITVTCSFYGPNARGNASILRDGLSIGQNQEILIQNGFGFTKCDPIMNLSTLINEQWYQRREIVVYLKRMIRREYPVDTLLSSSGTAMAGSLDSEYITASYTATPPAPVGGVFLVGVNLSGLETGSAIPGVAGTDYLVPTTAEMDYQASRGIRRFRIPFKWERMQPVLLGDLNQAYLGLIMTLVTHAAANNMVIIPDCHNYGRYGSNVFGDGTLMPSDLADLWRRLALAFVNNVGIGGYDIMNEPNNMPNEQAWIQAAQAAVIAIRLVDESTTIYCEGDNYSSAGAWNLPWSQGGNVNFDIVDPYERLIYSAHLYLDQDNSGTNPNWTSAPLIAPPDVGAVHDTSVGVIRLAVFFAEMQRRGAFGQIGETGTGNNNINWLTALDNELSAALTAGIEVVYWNAGPGYGSYFLGVEPAMVNGAYQDTVQMAVLVKYTGAVIAPAPYLSGPSRGTAGVASSAFTLTVRGYLTSSLTFTPSDQGAGGTFAPASIVIPPGFNGVATFTYTGPATAQVSKIGVTCPAGITAPPLLGYSTLADPFVNEPSLPTNILSLRLLNTPYIGPLFRAYLSTDTQMVNGMDVYPVSQTLSASFNQTALQTWANGTPIKILRYDQSGQGNNETLVSSTDNADGPGGNSPLAASINDLPTLVLNIGGVPSLSWSTNRTDANSPIAGSTAQSWFLVAQPTTVSYMEYCFGWQFVDNDVITGDSTGDWVMSGETGQTALSLGAEASTLRTYAGRYQAGLSSGRQTYRDGQMQASQTPVSTSIPYRYRSNLRIGYFPFYPSYFSGKEVEIITFNTGYVLNATMTAIQASQQSYWGTPIAPAQVTGLTLGTTTPTTQPLTWTAAANAADYTVQYRISGGGSWTTASSTVTGTSYTVTGLFSLTSYDYQVYATNGSGLGVPSSVVTAETAAYPAGSGIKLANIGVNMSGAENYPSPIIPSQTDALYYYNKGFTILRIPFNQKSMMPILGGSITSSYLSSLDTFVTYATGLGLKVALDSHNGSTFTSQLTVLNAVTTGATSITFNANPDSFLTGASLSGTGIANGTTFTPTAGNPTIALSAAVTANISAGTVLTATGLIGQTVTNACFQDYWNKIATHYASNPLVIFDLMNEPASASAAGWAASCNAAITGIRNAETAASVSSHTIFLPFPGSSATNACTAGQAFISAISDPANNLIYEVHQYNDSNGSGTSANVVSLTVGTERLIQITNVARTAGIKLFLGEFAVGADPLNTSTPALECLDNELAYLQQNADIWNAIAFWGGGDFTSVLAPSGGYYYGITPYNGQDTPWISHLRAYMSGGISYGYETASLAYPLVLTNATFGPAVEPAFGQALTGGFGDVSQGPNSYILAATVDTRVTLPATANLTNTPTCFGCNSFAYLAVNSTGNVIVTGSSPFVTLTSPSAINDGNPHSIRFCTDGAANSWLYVDGVMVATESHPLASRGFDTCIGSKFSNATYQWPGTIEYGAMYATALNTGSNYTPATTPPPLTTEPYRIAYWPLDGNGNGYA